jgi:hypothetical protein
MTPKEIVQDAFENQIVGWLESQGFAYSRSKFAFKKQQGDFVQRITVTLSGKNNAQSIRFWSSFDVSSPSYVKCLLSQGHPKPTSDGIGGCNDWNIPGWRESKGLPIDFDFSEPTLRLKVTETWRIRCERVGIPYLEQLSTWQGAAEDLLRWRWQYSKAADFFLIAGDKQRAVETLNAGIINFTTAGRADPFKELPSLQQRLEELKQ